MAQTPPATKPFAPFPAEADLHTWAAELDVVAAKLARALSARSRASGLGVSDGTAGNAERKNGWQLAELAGRRRQTACSVC